MAWPNRDIDYKAEFGVESKEELMARLNKVKELETENTTFKNKVTEQEGALNTVKEQLAAIEAKVNTRVEAPPNNNNNNNQPAEVPSVMDDENAAFATRMAPLYAQNLTTTAMVIEDQTLRRLREVDPRFSKFENEVRQLLQSTPLPNRANTNINPATKKTYAEDLVENCYYIVKGKYADRITQDTMAGKGDFFVEPARGSGNTGTTTVAQDPNELSADDLKVIQRMGVSKEVYLKVRNGNEVNMGGALSNKTSL